MPEPYTPLAPRLVDSSAHAGGGGGPSVRAKRVDAPRFHEGWMPSAGGAVDNGEGWRPSTGGATHDGGATHEGGAAPIPALPAAESCSTVC